MSNQTTLQFVDIIMKSAGGAYAHFGLYAPTAASRALSTEQYYAENRHRQGSGPWFHASLTKRAPDVTASTEVGTVYFAGSIQTHYVRMGMDHFDRVVYYHDGSNVYKFGAPYYSNASDRYCTWYITKYSGVHRVPNSKKLTYNQSYFGDNRRTPLGFKIKLEGTVEEQYRQLWSWFYSNMGRCVVPIPQFADPHEAMVIIPNTKQVCFDYKHNELDAYWTMKELGLMPNFYSSGFASAYVDMAEDYPRVASNMIENLFDAIDAVTSVLSAVLQGNLGGVIVGAGKAMLDPRNAYLAWRYSYRTTKSDIAEVTSVMDRLEAIRNSMDHSIECRGTFIHGDTLFRCSTWVNPVDSIPEAKNLLELSKTWGANMTFERAWDLIPYSFMVDWFAGVSEWLHYRETLCDEGLMIKFNRCWVSCRTRYDMQEVYMRLNVNPHDFANAMKPTKLFGSSNRTLVLRIADALSIFSR